MRNDMRSALSRKFFQKIMEQNRHHRSLNIRKQKTYDNLISKGINKMKKFTALSLALILVLSLFAGCSSKETASAKNPEVSEIVAKIDEVLAEKNGGEENMIAKMDGDDEMTSTFYYLNTEDLESYSLKFPMINVKAEETFVAKVKDGKMDAVKEGIEKRNADLVEQWKMYLPDQLELVEKSQIVVNGNYVLYVVSEHADAIVAAFNELTK